MRTPLFNPGDALKDKDNEREVVLVVLFCIINRQLGTTVATGIQL